MSMTDPLADMFTRIRNGSKCKFEKVDIPSSKMKREVARILKEEGFSPAEIEELKRQRIV